MSRIVLIGDRGDPANAMVFTGYVFDVMEVFDNGITSSDRNLQNIMDELGLSRGDDADDIGRPRDYITDHEAIKCIAQPSDITTQVACQFMPRW